MPYGSNAIVGSNPTSTTEPRASAARASADVTQEVLLAVWSEARSFDAGRGGARAWILTMTHRRAVDAVRREEAARKRDSRVAADRPFDEVAETVVDRSSAREVTQALECLSAAQRSAIDLAYFGGCTYREVAGILGVPLGTAKTRIRDGLRRLAVHLAEPGPTNG